MAAGHYEGSEPVNLGTGAIRELAALIADLVGFEGHLVYDPSKPDGRPRRCLDTSRALQCSGFRSHMAFREGMRKTIRWSRWRMPPPWDDPAALPILGEGPLRPGNLMIAPRRGYAE